MAALVRHDTITLRRAIDCIGADEPVRTSSYSAAVGPSLGIMPEAPGAARSYDGTGARAEPKAAEIRFPAPAYLHHVPGRLRLKAAEFRHQPRVLEAARRELSALHGVCRVSTNLLTGSILVEYDPAVLTPDALSEAMQKCGFPGIGRHATTLDTARQASVIESFAGAAVRTLLELCVERLFVAVIAAMI
jgi:copper chaperone CopZ